VGALVCGLADKETRSMNEAQTRAAKKVQRCLDDVVAVNKLWEAADRRLKRAQTELRRQIRRDPQAWTTLAEVDQ
jgi:hypothetical protein